MFARTILLAGAAFLLQPVSANATDNARKAVAIALPIVAEATSRTEAALAGDAVSLHPGIAP